MFNKFGVPVDYNTGKEVHIQPKLNNRMRVRFLGLGNVQSPKHGFDVTQQVVSVTKPTIDFTPIPIKVFGGTINVFNRPILAPISITLRDDLSNTMIAAIDAQVVKQFQFDTANTAYSSGSAKFTTIIESLDGRERIRAMDAWYLTGCYISSVKYGENNYEGGSFVTATIDITYDSIDKHISERSGAAEDKVVNMLKTSTSKGTDRA